MNNKKPKAKRRDSLLYQQRRSKVCQKQFTWSKLELSRKWLFALVSNLRVLYYSGKKSSKLKNGAWLYNIYIFFNKVCPIENNTNLNSNFCLIKSSKIDFIFLPAFYLIMWLMVSPKNFEKMAILKIWRLFSSELSKLTLAN